MQEPKITSSPKRKLIGMFVEMSLSEDKTFELWSKLMPRIKEITNRKNENFYSVQMYDTDFPNSFTPKTVFQKWACFEVTNFDEVPNGMETLTIPESEYAVFYHKGIAAAFPKLAEYIFKTWVPNSEFEVDNRPHFTLMGKKYFGHENPNSEEDFWVPIK